jgi:dTDP-4-dehydrorhamnose reductase
MRIMVIGGAGMLGHKVFQTLRAQFPGTMATTWEDVRRAPFDGVDLLHGDDVISGVDVTDFTRLNGLLSDIRPDFIINCVGIVKQRDEASRAIPCITLNALLPHQLAQWAAKWGGRVIHPSTDCVFSGRTGHYTEGSPSDAEDLYGRTKYLGELHNAENGLTLRTSIIGRELVSHRSLLDWFLSQNGKAIDGYRRVIYSGVTTNQFARVAALIIARFPTLHGLYQLVSEPIAKHDLLVLIRDAYGLDIRIRPSDTEVSDRSLCGEKLRAATGYISPTWPELVHDLAGDPTPYRAWLGERGAAGGIRLP